MSSGAPVASGVQAPASAIPWENVGPGWFVALWGRTRPCTPARR